MSLMSVATIAGVAPGHLCYLYLQPNDQAKPTSAAMSFNQSTTPTRWVGLSDLLGFLTQMVKDVSGDWPKFHVIPLGDLRDHVPEPHCWCNPTPDEDEPLVFLHHALDRRELYEQGDLLPA